MKDLKIFLNNKCYLKMTFLFLFTNYLRKFVKHFSYK